AAGSPFTAEPPPPPPDGGLAGAVVVGGVAAFASSFFSRPSVSTAASIATKKHATTTTYQPTCLPGKLGLRAGSTNDEVSANAMNATPKASSQIFCPQKIGLLAFGV